MSKEYRKILWPWLKRPPVLTFDEWVAIVDKMLEEKKNE